MALNTKSSSTLEEVLGTRSKIAVLRILFHSKRGYSGGSIAKQTGVALFAVQKTLAKLESVGLVQVERGSTENRYGLNIKHYLVANGLSALFEGERKMLDSLSRELRKLLEGNVIAAGLFGSFARGAARAGSDIDLFAVVQTLKDKERVTRILSGAQTELTERYGWPLQAVVFERRRIAHGLAKGQTLLDEAERDWRHVAGLRPRELRKTLGSSSTA
jgi:predicted nucleotidyltransferase